MPDKKTVIKKCSSPTCKNPNLPADTDHFFRNKSTKDGLSTYCKPCQMKCVADQKKKKAKKKTPPTTASNSIKADEIVNSADRVAAMAAKPEKVITSNTKTILTLDFTGYEDFLEDIIVDAVESFRSPERNIMALAHTTLYALWKDESNAES